MSNFNSIPLLFALSNPSPDLLSVSLPQPIIRVIQKCKVGYRETHPPSDYWLKALTDYDQKSRTNKEKQVQELEVFKTNLEELKSEKIYSINGYFDFVDKNEELRSILTFLNGEFAFLPSYNNKGERTGISFKLIRLKSGKNPESKINEVLEKLNKQYVLQEQSRDQKIAELNARILQIQNNQSGVSSNLDSTVKKQCVLEIKPTEKYFNQSEIYFGSLTPVQKIQQARSSVLATGRNTPALI